MLHEAVLRLHLITGSPSLLAICRTRLLRNLTLRNPGTDPRRHPTRKMKAYAIVLNEIIEIKCEGVNPLKRQSSIGVKSSRHIYTPHFSAKDLRLPDL